MQQRTQPEVFRQLEAVAAADSVRGTDVVWRVAFPVTLLIAALLTCAAPALSGERPGTEKGLGAELLKRVCGAVERCAGVGKDEARELSLELLSLPTLTDGLSEGGRRAIAKLAGDPEAQLELALESSLEALERSPGYGKAREQERFDVVSERLIDELSSTYWSILPDDLRWFERGHPGPGQSESNHVAIHGFSVDVKNSVADPNGSNYLLDVSFSVTDGPATHFRMVCDPCAWITFEEWTPWEEWVGIVFAEASGYLNVCLQVRAEPYQGNWENIAIACDEIGPPPSPEPPAEDPADIAPSNNPVQRCFGAIGNNCGPADEEGFDYGHCVRLHPFTQPDVATCQINAGSWEHDECCIEKRVGGNAPASEQGSCSPHMAAQLGQPYVCQAEFNTAVARLAMGLTWTRDVDATIENTSGVVEFAAYCAAQGSVVHVDDVDKYCCSGVGQPWVQHLGDSIAGIRWICL